jgi:hypothetical protein
MKMVTALDVCIKDETHPAVLLFVGVLRNERGNDLSIVDGQVWTELFAAVKCLRADRNV